MCGQTGRDKQTDGQAERQGETNISPQTSFAEGVMKNNIWQHSKTDSTSVGLEKFYFTFAGLEGDVDFSGKTLYLPGISQSKLSLEYWTLFKKTRWQVFTSCVGKWFNNYNWQSYFLCPIKLRYTIHKYLHLHPPLRFASCSECFQLREFRFCRNIHESSQELKKDTF